MKIKLSGDFTYKLFLIVNFTNLKMAIISSDRRGFWLSSYCYSFSDNFRLEVTRTDVSWTPWWWWFRGNRCLKRHNYITCTWEIRKWILQVDHFSNWVTRAHKTTIRFNYPNKGMSLITLRSITVIDATVAPLDLK